MLLNWLREVAPGKYEDHDDVMILVHDDGDVSSFYKRVKNEDISALPDSIRPIYQYYDGIDLFTNAFQIAAFNRSVEIEGKKVICSLGELAEICRDITFPEPTVPFMLEYADMEGNQWIYAAAVNSDKIYCFDTRDEVFDVYESVEEIIGGWLDDTAEENRRDGIEF